VTPAELVADSWPIRWPEMIWPLSGYARRAIRTIRTPAIAGWLCQSGLIAPKPVHQGIVRLKIRKKGII
jgi:hypothetical protein